MGSWTLRSSRATLPRKNTMTRAVAQETIRAKIEGDQSLLARRSRKAKGARSRIFTGVRRSRDGAPRI